MEVMTDEKPDKKPEPAAAAKLMANVIAGGVLAALVIGLFVIPRWGYRSPCAWLEREEYKSQFYVTCTRTEAKRKLIASLRVYD
jgi:hypothetical protein